PQPDVIVKRKLKYVDTDGVAGAPGAVRVAIDQSELRFTLDARSRVIALNGTERVRMGVAAAQPAASPRGQHATTIHIQLSNFRTGQAPESIGSLTRAGAGVENSGIVTHQPNPEQAEA